MDVIGSYIVTVRHRLCSKQFLAVKRNVNRFMIFLVPMELECPSVPREASFAKQSSSWADLERM